MRHVYVVQFYMVSCIVVLGLVATITAEDVLGKAQLPNDIPLSANVTKSATGRIRVELWLVTLASDANLKSIETARREVVDRDTVTQQIAELKEQRAVARSQYFRSSTLEDAEATIHFGEQKPSIRGVTTSAHGITKSIDYREIGTIVTIRPAMQSDKLIVVELKVEDSYLEQSGVTIFTPNEGEPILADQAIQFMHRAQVTCPPGGAVLVMATGDRQSQRGRSVIIYLAATMES